MLAHTSSSANATPPTIRNSGNVAISYLDVTFDGPTGQEASCDSGAGSWEAHASTAATDRFVLEAIASTSGSTSIFSSASPVAPSTGSGDVLSTTLEADQTIPLFFKLRMPNPPVAGASGCTVSLTVTAAAE